MPSHIRDTLDIVIGVFCGCERRERATGVKRQTKNLAARLHCKAG